MSLITGAITWSLHLQIPPWRQYRQRHHEHNARTARKELKLRCAAHLLHILLRNLQERREVFHEAFRCRLHRSPCKLRRAVLQLLCHIQDRLNVLQL